MKSEIATNQKIQCIDINSLDYPQSIMARLKNKAPKKIYCIGNIELATRLGLGFCGSRDVSEKGLLIAKDCAEQSAQSQRIVISGNARGVDRMVHKTALECGGLTILVLPEGINNFRINNDLKYCWDYNRALVISEFDPDATWKTWNAMQRNRTILSLSSAMIVIEAGETGGTLAAGLESIKMGIPTFVVNRVDSNSSKGSKIIIDNGGIRLNKSKKTNKANMELIFNINKNTINNQVQGNLLNCID